MKKVFIFVVVIFSLITIISCGSAPSGDIGAPVGEVRKIDIWDFGGVEATGTQYNNNITRNKIDAIDTLAGGKFQAGEINFGDLILNMANNDRAYYYTADGKPGKKSYGNQGYDSVIFPDGYESRGLFYSNGTGGEDRRFIIIKNVKAGDKITFYAITSNSAETNVFFTHINEDNIQTGEQVEKDKMVQREKSYEYIAKVDGSYKIFTDKEGGKPCYYRVVRTPSVFVSGTISIPGKFKETPFGISFVNQITGTSTEGKVAGNSFGAYLAPGYSYTAVISGVAGLGINDATKVVTVTKESSLSGKQNAKLVAEAQSILTVKGTIKGFEAGYDTSKMQLIFLPPKDSLYQAAKAKLEGMNFSALLEPNVLYMASFVGVNDYFVTAGKDFNAGSDFTQDISVGLKPKSTASGNLIGIVENKKITSIKFVNIDDEYIYEGNLSGNGYKAELRNGVYKIVLDGGYNCMMHIILEGANITKNILVHEEEKAKETLPLRKTMYVGYNTKGSYDTLGKAIRDAEKMNPKNENERITIYIAPGVYREQVRINVPYITLKNETPNKEAKLTWYYGIGYKYYSAGKDGFFSEDAKLDRFEKNIAARWGVATQILPGAISFRAEGITFESSFNKYITDEELADGVESDGSINFVRKLTSDVRLAKAKERSSAICVESANSEFYNCKFIGNQDTLFTGSGVPQYYRNCYIEGTTDYIFGEGDVVFENCELAWCGAPDISAEGHIAVAKSKGDKGYLFLNCTVTTLDGMKMGKATFGRPWEQAAKVAFINTKLDRIDSIIDAGWGSMSGNTPEKATFREFGTTYDGNAVDTSKRVQGTVLSSNDGYTMEKYLGSWKPFYSAKAPNTKPTFSQKPALTSNDDINTPYPGHILTVRYELDNASKEFDSSLIRWIRIGSDGKETVVKLSAGNANKSYTLQKADEDCTIRCEVIAESAGVNKGAKEIIKLATKVKKGFAQVAKTSETIGLREEGKINIFLAGDSTVKDYSQMGMYQGGINRDEGSWGEYLGDFFDSKKVVVKNYANGGRSTRNFINEGTLDKIATQIKKGDYLLIQFGHNDSSNTAGYIEDRHVPLGSPDAKGIYPTKGGNKVTTPTSYADRYGTEFYGWESGTYKWFLKKYIDVARNVGATPVLVTPVSRLNFQGDKIRRDMHHDSTDKNSPSQPTSQGNAYVQAVIQLAKEEKVLLIDAFEISANLYEAGRASAKKYPPQLFGGDVTHNNKLGGFLLAGLVAKDLKSKNLDISKSTIRPVKIIGANAKGKEVFTVGVSSTFYAFESGMSENYEKQSDFWTEYGQKLINEF
ncbi:MAG: hypothetical protein GX220_08170 [Treponema sp.]|nr:hypothetical protein [Treponema sp.]